MKQFHSYVIALICVLFSQSLYGMDIVVEQGGSICDAIRKARNIRRLQPATEGINIILRGGEYIIDEPIVLRPEDSGTKDAPLTIRSKEGEMAVVSGREVITGWKKEGRLWVAEAPMKGNRPMMIRQLWVDGRKAMLANQFGYQKMERMVDFRKDDSSIIIPTPKNITELQQEPLLEMLVHQRWAIAILRVKNLKVLPDSRYTKVTFLEPESRLEFDHPWPQPVIEQGSTEANSSYCLQNALCLTDEPGEWYQDRNGKIYYYPREGEDMGKTAVLSAFLENLLSVEGSPLAKVCNINIENIGFEYAAWKRPSMKGLVTLQGGFAVSEAYKLLDAGLPWDKDLENQAWIERPDAAVRVEWGDNINFRNCRFEHLAATALDYKTGMKNSSIEANRFTDIGGTAILAGSFSEGAVEVHNPLVIADDEYTEHLRISRNTIYDVTNEDWGAVGIGCGYVRHTHICENTISKMNYSGICVGWGWTSADTGMRDNHIDNNKVSDFARMLYDAGGIYTLSNQPNSTITGNRLEKLCKAPYATNDRGFYIYLDAKTDGYTISKNECDEPKYGDNHPGPNVVWK